jgi:hypothetical protein
MSSLAEVPLPSQQGLCLSAVNSALLGVHKEWDVMVKSMAIPVTDRGGL